MELESSMNLFNVACMSLGLVDLTAEAYSTNCRGCRISWPILTEIVLKRKNKLVELFLFLGPGSSELGPYSV